MIPTGWLLEYQPNEWAIIIFRHPQTYKPRKVVQKNLAVLDNVLLQLIAGWSWQLRVSLATQFLCLTFISPEPFLPLVLDSKGRRQLSAGRCCPQQSYQN